MSLQQANELYEKYLKEKDIDLMANKYAIEKKQSIDLHKKTKRYIQAHIGLSVKKWYASQGKYVDNYGDKEWGEDVEFGFNLNK